uniref:Uncharacterized protein n=1 Tax=Tanacetum cinerariifolium TaxID=118510 RepID=A0A6L2MA69_TANCI|nr:hypothetical protein [Tanacetum cinerariifolium]
MTYNRDDRPLGLGCTIALGPQPKQSNNKHNGPKLSQGRTGHGPDAIRRTRIGHRPLLQTTYGSADIHRGGVEVFFRLSRLFQTFKTLCFLNYALMTRHDYDLTSSLRRGALQRDPRNPWAYKEEMKLSDAIAANITRAEKKKKCRIVCRTHGVGSAHHAGSDGVPVSVPTVVPQGLALLLVDAATQTSFEDT